MRLFIAEKPMAAKDLASYLGITARGEGSYTCGQDVVTWCYGHLFESASPQDYDAALKKWSFDTLPIVPSRWKLIAKDKTKRQLMIIGRLLDVAQSVVNFGDPDNEGQLLVDEVLEYFKVRKPVSRLWLSAMDTDSIAAALKGLRSNADPKFVGMREAARARSRADWLVGMNFSRAYTLQAQAGGAKDTLTVGRVQTPTLALVHARCEAVANFRAVPFHTLRAMVRTGAGELVMHWKASERQRGLDGEGRLVDTAIADALVAKLQHAQGAITFSEITAKADPHPRCFSLTSLTQLASKTYGYKAMQVLEACQALYETYKLTSYPRTDCEYLPRSQHAEAPNILQAIAHNLHGLAEALEVADPALVSKTWDDAKITAHHAIIPRPVRYDTSQLPERERNIYQLVARAYLAQFFPLHEYNETQVRAEFLSEEFAASGKVVLVEGWKSLYREQLQPDGYLPPVSLGDTAAILQIQREDKKTKPLQLFTDGTLVAAMANIHREAEDEEDSAVLRQAEGIGTEATRAAIIDDLKKRGLLADQGKFVVSTPLGQGLLNALPDDIKSVQLAAAWEKKLRLIEQGRFGIEDFVNDQARYIADQVASVKAKARQVAADFEKAHPPIACPSCGGALRQRTYKSSTFWGCSNYPRCTASYPDAQGKPWIR